MNERIKELAEQAGFYFYDMHNIDGQDLGESIEADSWSAAQKFAELIVNECIGFLYPQLNEKYTPEELLHQAKYRNLIKEHFGVNNEI